MSASPPSRARLFIPFILFGIAVAAYTGWWFYAAGELERQGRAWIAEQEAVGYQIEHEGLYTTGYPLRLSLRARQPSITLPPEDGGQTITLTTLAVGVPPYDLRRWMVFLDGPLFVTNPAQEGAVRMTADTARFSIGFSQGRAERFGAEIENFTAAALDGAEPFEVQRLGQLLLTGELDGEQDRLTLRAELNEISLHPDALDDETARAFGLFAERVRLDAALTEWALLASGGDPLAWAQAGGRIEIRQSQLHWGPARLEGSGEVGVDAQRRPQGQLALVVYEIEALIQALASADIIAPNEADALRLAAALAPRREGGITLPFRLREGGVFLGPVRLADLDPIGE